MEIDVQPIPLTAPIEALQRALRPLNLEGPPIERDRTVPHVSELINIAKPYDGPHFEGLGDMGLLWEMAMRPLVREFADVNELYYLPGTIVREKDGVYGSLDGLMFGGDGKIIVVDTKLKFSKQDLPFANRAQMKAYCHMVGAHEAILPVGRILSRPPSAHMELVTLTFDDKELENNWKMLVAAKEQWNPKETT